MDTDEIVRLYICQICKQLPKSIVTATDGHFYCLGCIQQHLETRSVLGVILSPVSGKPIDKTLITPITIQALIDDCVASGLVDSRYLGNWNESGSEEGSKSVKDTFEKANKGQAKYMSIIGRWYLFGEKEGIESNEDEAYRWCKKAADLDDVDGMAYLGYCLIHGCGVDKNKEDGFELLVDSATERRSGMSLPIYVDLTNVSWSTHALFCQNLQHTYLGAAITLGRMVSRSFPKEQ